MKILLFGAQGMLGADIFHKSLEVDDITVIPYSRFNIDITDEAKITEAIAHFDGDAIVNAAAFTYVDKCENEKHMDQARLVNTLAPEYMAKACEEKQIPFYHFSTDYVFSGEKDQSFTEDSKPNPINQYGKMKAEGEERVLEYPLSTILRIAWLYGDHGPNFVSKMVHFTKTRSDITMIEEEYGNPTFTLDVVDALFEIIRTKKIDEKILHLINEGTVSRKELLEEIQNHLDLHTEIIPVKGLDNPDVLAKRPVSSSLKNTKFSPLPDWKDALHRFLEHEKQKIDKKREIEAKKKAKQETKKAEELKEKFVKENNKKTLIADHS